ncbi:unnamed protein product [Ostreobium quekettii]|uniref:Uncharacterized protein n=1 Tax=Ostreobium quekettii TaxID=121088 RepID=A0A8S1JC60_9CHLO|nr:unnamed protein product [Ostreobium quekettii]
MQSPTLRDSTAGGGDFAVQEAVWRDYFQPFAKDLGGLLDRLALRGPLDRQAHNLLHSMVIYMLRNSAWRLATFFLRMCMYSGIPVRIGPRQISEEDMEPSALRRLAEEFK